MHLSSSPRDSEDALSRTLSCVYTQSAAVGHVVFVIVRTLLSEVGGGCMGGAVYFIALKWNIGMHHCTNDGYIIDNSNYQGKHLIG